MLHTKFLGNRLIGSGEDLYIFTIYGCGGHIGHVTDIILIYFHFLVSKGLHTKYGKMVQRFLKKHVLILICKGPLAKVEK